MRAAQAIRSLIEQRGVTYTFLSKKTGISVDQISKSMRGDRRLLADELVALCAALGVDLAELRKA